MVKKFDEFLAGSPSSVADPGCLSRIRLFFHSGSEFSPSRIPDPGAASKNGFSALGNMIRVVHPGSGSSVKIIKV
jgi:hypothetical protein